MSRSEGDEPVHNDEETNGYPLWIWVDIPRITHLRTKDAEMIALNVFSYVEMRCQLFDTPSTVLVGRYRYSRQSFRLWFLFPGLVLSPSALSRFSLVMNYIVQPKIASFGVTEIGAYAEDRPSLEEDMFAPIPHCCGLWKAYPHRMPIPIRLQRKGQYRKKYYYHIQEATEEERQYWGWMSRVHEAMRVGKPPNIFTIL